MKGREKFQLEKPIMPLHLNENYKNTHGVVFVSTNMCLVIISLEGERYSDPYPTTPLS